ncbi:fluoride efflux transporter CrcB [Geomicrobium sediminis]|uniref:Fluoride-specific ion channel FluC n=1 Tax=Geomicrobium sediminis TaxID=1347788 RepID=A0ABS2P7X7_9BACL|nr:fluoride efflux transporter CrcB [Geomicrobium sediminis]MBM7631231.1 CrcB protein [Geomicrobium sediminis]
MNILAVTIGGAIGSLLRYLLGLTLAKAFQNAFIPVSMIVVNALGSFGLGAFIAIEQLASDSFIYATIAIGFFGGFTTFSTFSVEALDLFSQKRYVHMIVYVSLSVLLSIGFFILGYAILVQG